MKLIRASNPLGIPEDQLQRTFQIARDSLERVRISRVIPGSRAEKAKLLKDDIIISYDGKLITARNEYYDALEAAKTEKVELVILRQGKEMALTLDKGFSGAWVEPDYY